jgi:hypothetical protein
MAAGYCPGDIGTGDWARLASPVGALWLAGLAFVVIDGRSADLARDLGWLVTAGAVLVTGLVWLAAGLAAVGLGTAVEALWLGRWSRLGAPLVRWRRSRWLAHHRAAQAATQVGDDTRAGRHARRRNAIAVAPPCCPLWMADRWSALEARVMSAYGLDAAAAWPRLWVLLPKGVRTELRCAHAQWQRACAWGGWALLFLGLAAGVAVAGAATPAWVIGTAGLAFWVWAWQRGRVAVAYRADLVEATFDAHGTRLATALAVPLGAGGRLEPRAGEQITARIRKGT